MRVILLAVLILATTVLAADHAELFLKFKTQYKRVYKTPEEERYRYDVFVSNMLVAEAEQRANPHAVFGYNDFSDLTRKEFISRYRNGATHFATVVNTTGRHQVATPQGLSAGPAIDWRKVKQCLSTAT